MSFCLSASSRRVTDNACLVKSLPFEKVQHQIATLDAQPSSDKGGILVMVTGALLVCLMICLLPLWGLWAGSGLTGLFVAIGRPGTEAYELYPDLPAFARWPGKLLCSQRHFPPDLRGLSLMWVRGLIR